MISKKQARKRTLKPRSSGPPKKKKTRRSDEVEGEEKQEKILEEGSN